MTERIELGAGLLAAVALLTLLAKRLSIPAPIFLVPAGILAGFVPGLPHIAIDPQLVLTVFLPPLVYIAASALSWPDFWRNLRPITLLAVGCVLFTTLLVGLVAHWLLPWLPWAACFVLGAAVSPPDAVAATSMAGRLGLPRRVVTVLEGEGVVNDATALTAYRFAIAAVLTGAFSLKQAALTFALDVAGEVVYGLALGWIFSRLLPKVKDSSIEIALSLLVPFAAYLPPEQLGGSGVLATTMAGLYGGEQGVMALGSSTRLQARSVWEMIRFTLENLLFLVTGLELRNILAGIQHGSIQQLLWAGAVLCLAVILSRFVWVYPATYIPRWLFQSIRKADPYPPWQIPFVVAFAGMRGGISLAAALAIPRETSTGQHFPGRELIIFLTFCVIVVTLVAQGLSLPRVVRWLGLDEHGEKEKKELQEQMLHAWTVVTQAALSRIEQAEQQHEPEIVDHVRRRYEHRLRHLNSLENEDERLLDQHEVDFRCDLLDAERQRVRQLRDQGEINEEVRVELERDLDLEAARLTARRQHPEDE